MRFTVLLAITLASALTLMSGCASTRTTESTGTYVDNTVITGKVKTALAAEDLTSVLQIEVASFRGIVQLNGFVDSEEQKEKAGEIAETVDGVERVENSLIVKPKSS